MNFSRNCPRSLEWITLPMWSKKEFEPLKFIKENPLTCISKVISSESRSSCEIWLRNISPFHRLDSCFVMEIAENSWYCLYVSSRIRRTFVGIKLEPKKLTQRDTNEGIIIRTEFKSTLSFPPPPSSFFARFQRELRSAGNPGNNFLPK